ncbi:DUF551 domain-containing protein [Leclercia sp. S52]|uniref:DUF551 domain-containing protein n=1 Tax=Leclercia sp. S52 TaxID=3138178 RepID=UPI00321969EB
MAKLTKEFMQDIISGNGFGVAPSAVSEMARQLLASMEQEPVAWTTGGFSQNVGCNFGEKEPGEAPSIATVYWDRNVFRHHADCEETSDRWLAEAIKNTGAMPLYAAPQLPQPAPEVTADDCPAFIKYDVTDVAEAWSRGHNQCRSAMLQGAEPVQGWIPCSERMPPRIQDTSIEYLVYETLNNRVSHDYWSVPEGNKSCQAFWNHYSDSVTHWMPLPAAPQQEA